MMNVRICIWDEEIMFVMIIIDIVLFGVLICYIDGSFKLLVCFIKKFVIWECLNGVGCFVKKELVWVYLIWMVLVFFMLYEGNFFLDGVIFVIIMCSYLVDSCLIFEVVEELKLGQVCVFLDFGGNIELLYLVEFIIVVEFWIVREGYCNVWLEIVGVEDDERVGGVDLVV